MLMCDGKQRFQGGVTTSMKVHSDDALKRSRESNLLQVGKTKGMSAPKKQQQLFVSLFFLSANQTLKKPQTTSSPATDEINNENNEIV